MITLQKKIEHRHSRNAVARYMPVIKKYLEIYPEPVYFNFKDLKETTTTPRLRDAINAQLEHGYFSLEIDNKKLQEIWRESKVVGTSDGQTVICPSDYGFESRLMPDMDIASPESVSNIDDEDLLAIFRLLQKEIITGPICVRDRNTSEVAELATLNGFEEIFIETKDGLTYIM